jgi:hypothetical protein
VCVAMPRAPSNCHSEGHRPLRQDKGTSPSPAVTSAAYETGTVVCEPVKDCRPATTTSKHCEVYKITTAGKPVVTTSCKTWTRTWTPATIWTSTSCYAGCKLTTSSKPRTTSSVKTSSSRCSSSRSTSTPCTLSKTTSSRCSKKTSTPVLRWLQIDLDHFEQAMHQVIVFQQALHHLFDQAMHQVVVFHQVQQVQDNFHSLLVFEDDLDPVHFHQANLNPVLLFKAILEAEHEVKVRLEEVHGVGDLECSTSSRFLSTCDFVGFLLKWCFCQGDHSNTLHRVVGSKTFYLHNFLIAFP